jgi:hypothetical protein
VLAHGSGDAIINGHPVPIDGGKAVVVPASD